MNAPQAARKIRSLGGEVTATILIRYGVPEEQARAHMRWMQSKRGKIAERHIKKHSKRRGPIIFYGHNTAT